MIYLNMVFLILFTAGYIVTINKSKEIMSDINRKEHKLYFLYPFSNWIIEKTRLEKIFNRSVKVCNSMKALYVTTKPEAFQRLYWCSKMSLALFILVIFNFLSLIVQLQSNDNSKLIEDKYLNRPKNGTIVEELDLIVNMIQDNKVNTSESVSRHYTADVTIRVEERRYSEEERKKIIEEALHYINTKMLGDNESTDFIYDNLNFIKDIPGTSITVEWRPQDYNLIHRDGSVINEDIPADGIKTTVTAVLLCQEEVLEYDISLRILPKKYTEEERIRKKLEEEINKAAQRTEQDNELELPDKIDDYQLEWREKKQDIGSTLLFIGTMATILVWVYGDKELDNKMKKRKNQMLLDYPEIINKFTLLVNAGMTTKQAWCKIAEDYEYKISAGHTKRRFAYEEMIVTVHELRLGIAEGDAYDEYGRRAGLLPFMKFASLISQNLKKGSKGIIELLNKEASEAFEERKEAAKRLGEEAGTKLLAPMMIMLIIIFIIIMIPAFLSFGV